MGRMRLFSVLLLLAGPGSVALGVAAGAEDPAPALPEIPAAVLESLSGDLQSRLAGLYRESRERPGDPEAVGRLGMLLHAYEQYALAEKCYRRALHLQPDGVAWAYYLGVVFTLRGDPAAAAEAFRRALQLRPDYLPVRLKLADALLAAHRLEEAEELYAAVVREFPKSPWAHYGLGRIAAAGGRLESAIRHYQQACRLFPSFGAAHYALALAYRDQGERARAADHLALYQKDKLSWPSVEDPLLQAVDRLKESPRHRLKEAVTLGNRNQVQESIQAHLETLRKDPKMVQAHVNLISLYGQMENWEKAEEHYRATLQLNPNLTEAHYNYGVVLVRQGRYPEAAELFRKALAVNPYYALAHNNLGYMLELEGKLPEALSHYRQAVENDPSYRLARFNLGRMLVAQGKPGEAIEQFQRILEPQDDQTPRFLYALAAAYVRTGNREKALEYAREAQRQAESMGQSDLAATIARDLEKLVPGRTP